MKGMDLLKGIGYFDEDLLEEAASARPMRRYKGLAGIGIAACLIVGIAAAGYGLGGGRFGQVGSDSAMQNSFEIAEAEMAMEEAAPEAAEDTGEDLYAYTDEWDVSSTSLTAKGSEDGFFVPAEGDFEDADAYGGLELISGFALEDEKSGSSYAIPEDGAVGLSVPLTRAMESYGGSAMYQVKLDLFQGGVQLADESDAAREALAGLNQQRGITTAIETYTAADGRTVSLNTLHITYDQLTALKEDSPLEDYGCMLFLYEERAGE